MSRRGISSVRNADAVGAATAGLGAAISKAGERLEEIHDGDDVRRRDLEHVEQIRLIRDEARQAQGLNADTAAKQARTKIEALNGKLLASARSKRSRKVLEESLLRRSGTELSAITEHARVETTKALEGSILARRDILLEEAEEAWDRPDVLEQNLAAAQGEIAAWGKSKGLSPEAVALEQRAARAKIRTAAAQRMITVGDYDGALAYVETHSADIGHEAENALRATIREPMEEETAERLVAGLTAVQGEVRPTTGPSAPVIAASGAAGEVAAALRGHSLPAPVVAGFLGNIEHESRFRTSGPSGDGGTAHGLVQWRDERAVNFRRIIGKDVKQASVAEQVRFIKWEMDNPRAAGMTVSQRDAILNARTPQEAAGLIDKHYERSDGRSRAEREASAARFFVGGVPTEALTPTGRRIDYSEARSEIDGLGLPYDLKRKVVAALDRRTAAEDRVASRIEDDATKAALEVVEKLGDGFTSMSQIPANLLMSIPVTARISLAGQAQQNATPKPIPPNGEAALTLTLQSISDPEGFKKNDLRLYRGQVTPAEFEQLASTQARLRSEKHAAPTINLRSSIDSTIRFYARDVGLNVDAKSKPREREQYLKVFNGMERHIQAVTEGKRAPSDSELKAAFDRVTMEVETTTGDKGRWFEVMAPGVGIRRVEVPVTAQTRIVNAYRAAEGRVPSEAEMMTEYLRNKGRPGYWN